MRRTIISIRISDEENELLKKAKEHCDCTSAKLLIFACRYVLKNVAKKVKTENEP